jgi:hypothetical protein
VSENTQYSTITNHSRAKEDTRACREGGAAAMGGLNQKKRRKNFFLILLVPSAEAVHVRVCACIIIHLPILFIFL